MTHHEALDTVIELYEAIDTGDVDQVLSYFSETATFETSLGTSTGTDELRSFFTGRIDQPGKQALHVLANARVREVEPGVSEVTGVILLFGPDPASPPAFRLERAVPALHRLRFVHDRWVVQERGTPGPPPLRSTISS